MHFECWSFPARVTYLLLDIDWLVEDEALLGLEYVTVPNLGMEVMEGTNTAFSGPGLWNVPQYNIPQDLNGTAEDHSVLPFPSRDITSLISRYTLTKFC